MSRTLLNYGKKILAAFLVTLFLVPLATLSTPRSAQAQVPAAGAAGGTCTGKAGATAGTTAGTGAGTATAEGTTGGTVTAVTAVIAVPTDDIAGNTIMTGMATVQGVDLGVQTGQLTEQVTQNTTWCWKEFVLDVVFYLLNNVIIEQLTASIVNWINGGFEGSPQFTLDLQGTLEDVGQLVIGGLVKELSQKTGKDFGLLLCTNFASELIRGFQVELAVRQSAGKDGEAELWRKYQKCDIEQTLTNVGSSIESFGEDFSNGGWPAWLKITEPNNNRYGAYVGVRAELARRLEEAKFIKNSELSWNRGFLSWKKKCASYDTDNGQAPPPESIAEPGYTPGVEGPTGRVRTGECNDPRAGQILTPGSVVENQLNDALGSGRHRIEIADEVNEVIGALLGQLMNQVFGPGGLLGASKSSNGSPSYTDQLTNSSEQANQARQIILPQITAQIENIEAYEKIYTSAVADITAVIALLTELRACYIRSGGTYSSQLGQIDQTIGRLTTRREMFRLKAADAAAAIDKYEQADSSNDIVLLTESLAAIDPTAFNTPYVAAKQVEDANIDLQPIRTQAEKDLATCTGTVQP